eukprot:TRINITY_DN67025_c2_g1_i1.p1 TRINITY_DN67025_c2_g1~~TRINITY_DN67025_c2_g1_i1.p1  ORF type:complete len:426 (+),score=24.93 TRINITY_DN67025_c2_g1_i1:67-1344(+)
MRCWPAIPGRVTAFLISIFVAKLAVFTFRIMLPPYITFFADMVHETPSRISAAISMQSITYTIAACCYPFLKRYFWHSSLLFISLIFLGGFCLVLVFSTQFWMFAIAMMTIGMSPGILYPSTQSLISQLVPFEYQMFATVGSNASWGTSTIFGLPVAGVLMHIWWSLPFLVFVILAGCCAFGTLFLIRPMERAHNKDKLVDDRERIAVVEAVTHAVPFFTLLNIFFSSFTDTLIATTFSVWLRYEHGYSLVQVAGATMVMSIGILVGDVLTILMTPFFRTRNGVLLGQIGTVLFSALYMLTPLRIPLWCSWLIIGGWFAVNEIKVGYILGFCSEAKSKKLPGCASVDALCFVPDALAVASGVGLGIPLWDFGGQFLVNTVVLVCVLFCLVAAYCTVPAHFPVSDDEELQELLKTKSNTAEQEGQP